MTSYNLEENAHVARRVMRQGMWTFGGIATGYLVLWGIYQVNILRQLSAAVATANGGLLAFDLVLEVGLPASALWLLFYFWVRYKLGPTHLDVQPNGLTFRYATGKCVRLPWYGPRLDLLVRDIRSHPLSVPQLRVEVELPWRALPHAHIPETALDEILAAARREGALIRETTGRDWPYYSRPVRYLRIRGSVRVNSPAHS
jgi:hypothetical protein